MSASDLPEAALSAPGGFREACRPEHLVVLSLNVGDGDCHVLVLPEVGGGRCAVIVDAVDARKLHALLIALADDGLLDQSAREPIPLVVATHPHDDHIRGMARLLRTHADAIGEIWEPGYYHTSDAYLEMMAAVEDSDVRHLQPAAGTVRWLGAVRLTVLAPGVALKSRYDSYGIEINDASIVLKIDHPATRVVARSEHDRTYVRPPSQTIILGADAQTTSWSQVIADFPQLGPERTAVSTALRMQNGVEPLSAAIFKVPHHGSKRGLNFELVEHVSPKLTLFSCGREHGRYSFPHAITQEIVREALEPVATRPEAVRAGDDRLGIHYTGSHTDGGRPAGSIAVLVSPGGRRQTWRFMDDRRDPIVFEHGRRVL